MTKQDQFYLIVVAMFAVAYLCRIVVVLWYGRERIPPEDQYADDSWGDEREWPNGFGGHLRHPSQFKQINDNACKFEESMK